MQYLLMKNNCSHLCFKIFVKGFFPLRLPFERWTGRRVCVSGELGVLVVKSSTPKQSTHSDSLNRRSPLASQWRGSFLPHLLRRLSLDTSVRKNFHSERSKIWKLRNLSLLVNFIYYRVSWVKYFIPHPNCHPTAKSTSVL